MKKSVSTILAFIFILSTLGGCRNNPENARSQSEPPVKWSENEIEALFVSKNDNHNWEIINCVVASDFAFNRVGVILFVDKEKQTSNVAFMDANGYYQMCGVNAQLYAENAFTYCGNGVVSFKLQTDEGIPYNCKIICSIEGGDVSFIVEDESDLSELGKEIKVWDGVLKKCYIYLDLVYCCIYPDVKFNPQTTAHPPSM